MSKSFDFKLVTPEETVFEGQITEVLLPTKMGQIGVLADHERLVTILVPGEIVIKVENGEDITLASLGGYAEIEPGKVNVMSDSAIKSDKIDALAAEEAKKRAEQAMENAQNDREVAEASAALEKALLHIQVANRKKRHH